MKFRKSISLSDQIFWDMLKITRENAHEAMLTPANTVQKLLQKDVVMWVHSRLHRRELVEAASFVVMAACRSVVHVRDQI